MIRVARAGGAERATASLDFLPDNIDYAPDGSLYVTGQNVDPKQLMAGCPSGTCMHGTTALQVGDTIFLGSYRGDAVAYMRAPKVARP